MYPTYELIVETPDNVMLSNHSHDEEGFNSALHKVGSLRKHYKTLIATIWSSKDDLIVYTCGEASELIESIHTTKRPKVK